MQLLCSGYLCKRCTLLKLFKLSATIHFTSTMKHTLICVWMIFSSKLVLSQDPVVKKLQAESTRAIKKEINDTSRKSWKTGGLFNISAGQGSLSNWAAGGDDFSLTVATSLNLWAFYKKEKHSWTNTLDVNFGYVKTTSLGSRKNDDRFDAVTKYGYAISNHLHVATLVNFRSQFLKGYTYKDNVKTYASDFLSPGYIVFSQGFDYKAKKNLSVFLSPLTSRWIIVTNDSISSKGDYGVLPGREVQNHLGAFATINYQKSFNKHVSYRGRLDLFSNYKQNPENADLYMTNALSARFAKILAFSWNLDLIYDDDVRLFGKDNSSPALQLKSIVGVGLQVKI